MILFFFVGWTFNLEFKLAKNITPDFNHIFLTNLLIINLLFILSTLSFGIISAIFLLYQMTLIGALFFSIMNKIGLFGAIIYLFTHGVFELCSLLISVSSSIYIAYLIYVCKNRNFWKNRKIIYTFLFMNLLILLAAIIETFITPFLIKNLF